MKVWFFALSFLIISLLASLVLVPQNREASKRARAAQLEFENYRAYEIMPTGVTRLMTAEGGRHYADREELDFPVLVQRVEERLEGVSAASAVMIGQEVTLKQQVNYWNNEGYTLFTEEAVYNRQTQLLRGRGGFSLEYTQGRMDGREFVVDGPARTVKATEVRALLNVKE